MFWFSLFWFPHCLKACLHSCTTDRLAVVCPHFLCVGRRFPGCQTMSCFIQGSGPLFRQRVSSEIRPVTLNLVRLTFSLFKFLVGIKTKFTGWFLRTQPVSRHLPWISKQFSKNTWSTTPLSKWHSNSLSEPIVRDSHFLGSFTVKQGKA